VLTRMNNADRFNGSAGVLPTPGSESECSNIRHLPDLGNVTKILTPIQSPAQKPGNGRGEQPFDARSDRGQPTATVTTQPGGGQGEHPESRNRLSPTPSADPTLRGPDKTIRLSPQGMPTSCKPTDQVGEMVGMGSVMGVNKWD